jgi:hypothetical protein
VSIQELGSIGEFVAAIATLLTLVYLALQIRQNTTTVRAGTSAAISESLARVTEVLGSDPRAGQAYLKGLLGDASLDAETRLQFASLFSSYLRRVENAFYQHARGFVDPDHWETTARTLSVTMRFPGARRQWEASRNMYSDRFGGFVDRCIAEYEADSPPA